MKKTREIDLKLGENIVRYRTVNGMNRKALAEATGITHQQMQKYEKGINRISVSRLFDIASVLKVSVPQLLNFENNMMQENPENRAMLDIMKYISRIKDRAKLEAIKNIIRTISGVEAV